MKAIKLVLGTAEDFQSYSTTPTVGQVINDAFGGTKVEVTAVLNDSSSEFDAIIQCKKSNAPTNSCFFDVVKGY